MAGQRTGTPLVLALSRRICKTVAKYGIADFEATTSVGFRAAIGTLIVACLAFEAADDHPGEIDATAPFGPGDIGAPPAS